VTAGPQPLRPSSTVDQLAGVLRARILDGELEPGRRLVERELVATYDVARHTLRSALRRLEVEGLVTVEPNRGARVAKLEPADLADLFALRLALEREAAHLALERGGGRLPRSVHDAVTLLDRTARRRQAAWKDVAAAHSGVHEALVAAARAPRIERAYAALSTEIDLFLSQLRPVWTRARLGPDHLALVEDLERDGPDVLREHMALALRALHADGRSQG
jgi:DNA-binding GntR family transcriptional regulator